MPNSQGMCNTFKRDILNGLHAFGASVARVDSTKDAFKMALYYATANISKSVSAYTATGEITGTGYTATGVTVTNANAPLIDVDTACWTPSDSVEYIALTEETAFNCALLYNDTSAGKLAVAAFTFGDQTVTAGTFTLTMPVNNEDTGLIRLA